MQQPTSVSSSSDPKIAWDKVAHNDNIVYKCKIFISLVFGIVAGIFGLTGLSGFLFYVVVSLVISSVLIGFCLPRPYSVESVFPNWTNIIFGGFTQGLLTYILFWTISYDIVYIFF
ncbi:hypothetical protein FDP41_013481 [Naegleria fowleri]|uniref:ER membrane protein complex subunit 6 n=1 Tax=Naegleria fowleri TaxID=5763 RepID=A0A6A5BSV9_NAEFO|nr:uncharacterized protein FDP41_013481 [Naegleria fowleri]KAF0980267.1 hypothetical protein FDP41_013481 [Naegleria fowleri]CAG4713571.1 unnamed protein product [Naegleria fowleri]